MQLFLVLFFLLGIPSVAPEFHSLKAFYTGSSQVPNFPEFVAVGLFDEVQIVHYDSHTRRFVPKHDLLKKFSEGDPTQWNIFTQVLKGHQQWFRANMEILKQRFNQTQGVHVFQNMYGCEWDDETGELDGYNQYGFDGEDFISLDLKTETWIAPVRQAVFTKHQWDKDKARLAGHKKDLLHVCPDWLKKFVKFGGSSLMRKDLPSVSLLQKTPSSPVTCHATGFYPDRADLFWQRDEEELHEEVVRGETLPNHDGSFQMSVDLDLSGVRDEDWGRYSCVFHLAGGQEVLTPLDRHAIRTNWRHGFPSAAVVSAVVALLVLTGCFIGLIVWKRNWKASEASSSSGEDPAVKRGSSEEQSILKTSAENQESKEAPVTESDEPRGKRND
ncbi:major histocompatibility complex class I-related gene protein-like isoform X2 [Salarias fasciatus]|uniref:Major histocompatibility complex class I-related gene protein-like n=1 Tax=Salarias fasciatus TaxID=181472 RepID=A0A672HAE4_SALFA|nr:major histocompatibility complex class I-related gene protein-like isoform X2 [Salarias fasciatus]